MSLVVMRRKYKCTRNGNRCGNTDQNNFNFKGNQSVMMKKKQEAIRGSKPTTKRNIYRNKYCVTGDSSKTINKSINYHSYYNKKKQRCGCDKSLTVKTIVNNRKTSSQKILEKKLKVLQRINCDLKASNGKPLKTKLSVDKLKSVGYTRKENKYRYCNTTKDMNLNTTYAEKYTNLMADRSYNCQDEKDNVKIKDSSHCGVY